MPYYLTEDDHTSKRRFVQFYCDIELSSLFRLGCWARRSAASGPQAVPVDPRCSATGGWLLPSALGLGSLVRHPARPCERGLLSGPQDTARLRGICSDCWLRSGGPASGWVYRRTQTFWKVCSCSETVVQRRARRLNPPTPSFWGRCVPLTSRGKSGQQQGKKGGILALCAHEKLG